MKDYRKLLSYLAPHKAMAAGNIFFNLLGNLFGLFTLTMIWPFTDILFEKTKLVLTKPDFEFTREAITNMLSYFISIIIKNHGAVASLFYVSIAIVCMSFLKNSFLFLASYKMNGLMNLVVRDIQNTLHKKILQLPLSYFSEERKGNIMARLTNDVQEVKFSIMSSLEIMFRDPITIILYFAALITISPTLTGIVILLLPFSGALIGIAGSRLRAKAKLSRDKYGDLISVVEETLGGIRVIKAFNAEKTITNRFEKENNFYTKLTIKVTRIASLASPLSEFLGTVIMIVLLYIGGRLVLNSNDLSAGSFLAYLAIFSQILPPVKSLSSSYYNIQKGLGSMDRINAILHAETAINEKPDAKKISTFNSKIEFRNVNFRYDEKGDVLKNINLVINKGQTIALVGQSGSGKSTLVDLLPRFWDIQSGEILIDDVSIKDLNITDLRNLMGNVNQEAILFNESFFNNIAFGVPNASLDDVQAAAKVANAHDFIQETPQGYQTNIGDRGNKISGGQRQRVSIARAVLKNPPIMILDEATSALDTESERLVQEALTNLMKNRTSVVIAHRLSTIKNADIICVLHEGEIVERGKHDELLEKNGVYKKLHDLQMF